ncbi:MAG: HD-GYP domain-containing protein [Cetobacterium sp.]|uniref:HD-GYP domain-containing protein n=1 Tax=Cetobacterium sp. TaxID=2071632 RepID=UPI003EE7EDC4
MLNKERVREICYKIRYYYNKSEDKDKRLLSGYKLANDLENHLIRVSQYAEVLSDLICLDSEKVNQIKKGALLHDIGKKMVDQEILNKPFSLTLEESQIIKEHSKLGLKILSKKHENKVIENIILLHHEKWDGNGYPFGLSKTAIPIEARVVSIADCYDALTTNRVYKNKISHEKALEILKYESGKSFDPDIVSIFEIFENRFKEILEKTDRMR